MLEVEAEPPDAQQGERALTLATQGNSVTHMRPSGGVSQARAESVVDGCRALRACSFEPAVADLVIRQLAMLIDFT